MPNQYTQPWQPYEIAIAEEVVKEKEENNLTWYASINLFQKKIRSYPFKSRFPVYNRTRESIRQKLRRIAGELK